MGLATRARILVDQTRPVAKAGPDVLGDAEGPARLKAMQSGRRARAPARRRRGVDRSGHQDRLADDRRGTTGAGGRIDGVLWRPRPSCRCRPEWSAGWRRLLATACTVGGDARHRVRPRHRRRVSTGIRGSEFARCPWLTPAMCCATSEGPMRASELVERCDVSKQAISQQIAHLAANDYVALGRRLRAMPALAWSAFTTKGERAQTARARPSSRSSATGRASSGSRSSTASRPALPPSRPARRRRPLPSRPSRFWRRGASQASGRRGPARAADEVGDPVAPRPCARGCPR